MRGHVPKHFLTEFAKNLGCHVVWRATQKVLDAKTLRSGSRILPHGDSYLDNVLRSDSIGSLSEGTARAPTSAVQDSRLQGLAQRHRIAQQIFMHTDLLTRLKDGMT